MAYILLLIGLLAAISGIRGTQNELGKQVVSDFTGEGNFVYWVVAIFAVGAVGYIKGLEKLSDAFLVLLILVLVLAAGNPGRSGGGFFEKFMEGIKEGTKANQKMTAINAP